jgi:hypothetical protein
MELVLMGIFLIGWIIWELANRGKFQEQERAAQIEEARKEAAFLAWYYTLPAHEQYLIDQQLKAGKQREAMLGLMAWNNLQNTLHRH